ncbi:MAG: serine protease AprX, partial [Frankiaceae bacterium]|nr:serine protease AprX [Frankiaceae bacterium]
DVATYFTGSGTSFAAPLVAGIIALLFQADPHATPARVEQTLLRTAYPFRDGAAYRSVGGLMTSYDKGAGLVDAYAAARALGAARNDSSASAARRRSSSNAANIGAT